MSEVRLTSSQRRRLRAQLHEAEDASYYRRPLAILELDGGQSVAEVADALGVTRQSVYNWTQAYAAAHDVAALRDHYGIGRPHPVDHGPAGAVAGLLASAARPMGVSRG